MFDFDLTFYFFYNEMKVRKITLHAFVHLEGFRLNDVRMKKEVPNHKEYISLGQNYIKTSNSIFP
jgi:hypothetical protein